MHQTDNVTVVIRSATERTEALCIRLVEKQVPSRNITVIWERPFRLALSRAYQIGIEANREWTLCIDADILIRDRAIDDLITFGEGMDEENFGCSGFLFHKFRGGAHSGGAHLYRSKYLSEAQSLIPKDDIDARPESYVKIAMRKRGHDWLLTKRFLGLHDFEQYYRDIFRKMAVRAYRSPQETSALIEQLCKLARTDKDFLVALWGLRIGKTTNRIPTLDTAEWQKEIEILLTAHGIQEKDGLPPEQYQRLVSRLMAEEAASIGILDNNAFILSIESKTQVLKTMKIKNWIWYAGWLLNRFGVKIQKHMST